MSIASELNNLSTNILNAYDAIETKGGTIPTNKNMVNIPSAVDSIPAGGSFTGIPKSVVNSEYTSTTDVTEFAIPSEATSVSTYMFWYAFYQSPSLKKFDAHSITTANKGYAFARACESCGNLETIDFSNLATVTGQGSYGFQSAFSSCSKLTSASFPKLTSVAGQSAFSNTFTNCTGLTNVSFPLLASITGQSAFNSAFQNCRSLTSVNFSSLATVSSSSALSYAFRGCTSLTELRFPSLSSVGSNTNQFNNMLYGVSGCTVHFPSTMQATIGSWASVTSGFGGTNTTVLFDL